MALELTGTLYRKMDTQRITDSFQKRDFVIETQEQYPQLVKIELHNDKCSHLDGYNLGDKIKVSFNVRGREWKKDDSTVTYFTSLQAWKLEAQEPTQTATQQQAPPKQAAPVTNPDEDLPF